MRAHSVDRITRRMNVIVITERQLLATLFVQLYQFIAEQIGSALALIDATVQAARKAYLEACA